MNTSRLNRKTNCWVNSKSNVRCKNWHHRVSQKLSESNFYIYRNTYESLVKANVLRDVQPFITKTHIEQWSEDINRDCARTGTYYCC